MTASARIAAGTLLLLCPMIFLACPGTTGPEAAFNGGPRSGPAPLSVQFTDESDEGAAQITAWLWDFGDGQTSTLQHPVHVYQTPGSYTVSLTVTTSEGGDVLVEDDFIEVTGGEDELNVPISYNVSPSHPLAHVQTWAYVIQDQTAGDKIARLAASEYDLIVIDDPRTFMDEESYDAAADVAALHATQGCAGEPKLVLAYVDIGEAESYRYYWQTGWRVGSPSWIMSEDPDGWSDNYPVAYWNQAWHDIVYAAADSLVDRVVSDGYDGIYLDWIEAATFEPVVDQAQTDGVDPLAEMTLLIQGIRDKARGLNPNFLIVAQNATDLRTAPGYLALLDAQAQEQVFFDGSAEGTGPTDPQQGDCRLPLHEGGPAPSDNPAYCLGLDTLEMSSEEYVVALADYLEAGIPVFVVDYALQQEHADYAYAQHERFHFVGLVTMRSLEDLTATPPPALADCEG
ncbi:MAG TPA: endo alpha-1,4 polygalactosaminidase [Candidatus Hydrogenedentes bacterium]|nr:endo alpha-1,4 polygalactosaminidase [Candidatus Hydrogenedentota bacterium]HQE82089.1 endo alpha-1,4 polygalactosaminidase [Candidatus Hydrogenedentota bacterium]HQH52410.1 endo alpha-1,4 polygalactosaminidase [Candidatus Hydrogenedentota bacterium]HQM49090.1 endo alpha-1,4 polygalactosaminidase [Candidatus Hydrogenedentota bacterium]